MVRSSDFVKLQFHLLPVYPHDFLKVNTLFEVVRAAGGYTAWSDKHPS